MIETINLIADKWFTWQTAMLWQVAVLIAIVAAVDLLIRKWAWPQVRYALWLLVLLKLVLPPTLTLPTSLTARIPGVVEKTVKVRFTQPTSTTPATPYRFESVFDAEAAVESTRINAPILTESPMPPAVTLDTMPLTRTTIAPEPPGLSLKVYALLAWLGGVVVLAGWLIGRLRRFRREHLKNINKTNTLPRKFCALLEQTAAQLKLKKIPRVVLTDKVKGPAVFGVFRPVLLMPAEKLANMTRQETEHILLHELAHIKRGDLVVHSIQMVLQIAYWFNPLVWLTRKPLQSLRELCCDATVARVLKDKTSGYRETLLETARQLLAEPAASGMGLLGLFENSHRLPDRLKWLERKTWKNRPLRIALIGVLVGVMLSCVLPMARASDKHDSRRVKVLTKILQEDSNQKRGNAAEELIEKVANEKIANTSAGKVLKAITSRINRHPKTVDRQRGFDSYPSIYWEELGLGFELIVNDKVKKDQTTCFLQALELVGCTYGVESDGVFRLFGQFSIPRRDIFINYKLRTLSLDGKSIEQELLDVYPMAGSGNANWGRETMNKLDTERSLRLELRVAWYQIPDSMAESLPATWREKEDVLKNVVKNASIKKLCEYTRKLELSENSNWQGIFGEDFSNIKEAIDFIATLDDGDTLELVGVREHSGKGKQWWCPDGILLDKAPDTQKARYDKSARFNRRTDRKIEIVYKCSWPISESRTVMFRKMAFGVLSHDYLGELTKDESYYSLVIAVPKKLKQKTANITIGIKKRRHSIIPWVVFKNVSLRPGVKSDVQVEGEEVVSWSNGFGKGTRNTADLKYWRQALDLDGGRIVDVENSDDWVDGLDITFKANMKAGRKGPERTDDFVAVDFGGGNAGEKRNRRILRLESDSIDAAAEEIHGRIDELKNSNAVMNGFYMNKDKNMFAVLTDGVEVDPEGAETEISKAPSPKIALVRIAEDKGKTVRIEYWLSEPIGEAMENDHLQNAFVGELPNGVTVELLGVCDIPADGKQWWAADGSPVEDVYWDGTSRTNEEKEKARQVVLRINSNETDPDLKPSMKLSVHRNLVGEGAGSWVGVFFVHEAKSNRTLEELGGCSFSLHDDHPTVDISATVDFGPWKTQGTKSSNSYGDLNSIHTNIGTLIINDPTEKDGKTSVSATLLGQVKGWRIVAIDKQGKTHNGSSSFSIGFDEDAGANTPKHQLCTAKFALPLSQIEKFQFQTRETKTVEFKNVSLRPGGKTDVQIEVERAASNNSGGDSKRIQSITFKEGTSIRDALRFLGKAYKKNIIPSDKVDGRIPVSELYDVTFEETLQAILGPHKYIIEGDFIRVYTAQEYKNLQPTPEKASAKPDVKAESLVASAAEYAGRFKALLPNNVTVQLAAICNHPSPANQWWRADGAMLDNPIYVSQQSSFDLNEKSYAFVVIIENTTQPSVKWTEIEGATGSRIRLNVVHTPGFDLTEKLSFHAAKVQFAEDAQSTAIKLQIACDRWRTQATYDGRYILGALDAKKGIYFAESYETAEGVKVAFSHDITGVATRLVAEVAGRVDSNARLQTVEAPDGSQRMLGLFSNVKLAKIKCFRLETRPYHYVTFESVPLRPNTKIKTQPPEKNAAYDLTKASDYIRHYLDNMKTQPQNDYTVKRYEIIYEYTLKGDTGAVACVRYGNFTEYRQTELFSLRRQYLHPLSLACRQVGRHLRYQSFWTIQSKTHRRRLETFH